VDGTRRSVTQLLCVECGALSDAQASGWRGYRLDECDDDEPPGNAFYCSACANREFGLLRPRWRSVLDDEGDVE
jgi:hypothetical protein